MGLDDDADCAGHVWELTEVGLGLAGAQLVDQCTRCGTIAVERPARHDPNRQPL